MRRQCATKPAQQEMDLSPPRPVRPTGRGGRRPGAGRPKGRTKVGHVCRERFVRRHPLHVTLRVVAEAAGLDRRDVFPMISKAIANGGQGETFRVVQFNVLSNHIHLICEAEGTASLATGMQGLCVRIARGVNRTLRRRGTVFAERYHARVMASPRQVRNTLIYVLQNRCHHARSARGRSFDPWSSAPWFDGWTEPLPRDAAWMREALAAPCPVAPARTWLLEIGWQRHGKIALDEQPVADDREP